MPMTSSSITFIEKAKHGYREKAQRPRSFPGQGSAVFSLPLSLPHSFQTQGFQRVAFWVFKGGVRTGTGQTSSYNNGSGEGSFQHGEGEGLRRIGL